MPHAWIGTSGFSYPEWRPSFYPEKMSPDEFLSFYAARFNSVEIDRTFYRMPNEKTLDSWKETAPEGFRFALKASQKITHFGRIKVPSESLTYLTGIVPRLGDRLGVLLFQLPPFLKYDLQRLEAFLAALPAGLPVAFEFRNEGWFTEPVYDLLRKHPAGLVIHDQDEGTTPEVVTGPLVYLRLRRAAYSADDIRAWQERIRGWMAGGADVYAYIKHEENPDAPRIAGEFAQGLR